MPAPTYSQAWAQIRAVKNLLKLQQILADSFTGAEQNLTSILQYVPAADALTRDWYENFRSEIGNQMDSGQVQAAFDGPLTNMMHALGIVPGTFEENARRLRDYMIAQGDSIRRYGMTYNAVGVLNGTGGVDKGLLIRRSTDVKGNPNPGGSPETKDFIVSTLTRFIEGVVVDGDPEDEDGLTQSGSGLSKNDSVELIGLSSADTAILLNNPQFQKSGQQPTADPVANITLTASDELNGWTINTPANVFATADPAKVYRGFANSNLPIGLGITGDVRISQDLLLNINPDFDPEAVYLVLIAIYKDNASVDGDFDASLGAKSFATVDMAALNVGFNVRELGFFTLAEINQLTRVFEFDITNKTTTDEVVISNFIIAPGTRIDALDHWLVGGRDPFISGDKFSVTDSFTALNSGELDEWLVRRTGLAAEGIVLPTLTAGETIAD